MASPQEFVALFARTLDLFRDPGAKEEQKAQFRTLAGLLKLASVTLAVRDGHLVVNGTTLDGKTLLQRLEFHSVKEIAIPTDPPLGELFELLRALADQPGDEDIASRLRANGAQRISVTIQTFLVEPPAVPVQQAAAVAPPSGPAKVPGTPEANDVPEIVREASATHAAFSPAAAASSTPASLIAQLRDKPDGPHVGDVLAVLGRQLEAGMKAGTDQLVHMLGHHEWFVVRNVAELAGELGLDEAVPALAQQLDHEDERVRIAVASALAKIGSSAAAEPLRRALRDKSPEVRMQAALGVGGRKSSALAMPLVVAMEEEEDEGVERELILALGRIGSASAVQALIKFAQPGGRLFGRRPAGLRATAVEALRLAATPAAIGTLEGLTDDGDKQVRAAAQSALADLKHK